MQVLSIETPQTKYNTLSFRQSAVNTKTSCTDDFIAETNRLNEKKQEGGWFAKTFRSTTAGLASAAIVLGYDIFAVMQLNKYKTRPYKRQQVAKKLLAGLVGATTVAIGVFVLIQKYLDKISDSSNQKNEELFNSLNKTNAKFNKSKMNSTTIGAVYDILSGEVTVNNSYSNDPIGRLQLKKLLKHELEHARQFEMIAALDDGIAKLNYAVFCGYRDNMMKDPLAIKEIRIMYDEIQKDSLGKYDNAKVKLGSSYGEGVSLKAFITGLKMFLDDANVDYKNLPMLINEEHYKEAVEKRGPLTDSEKEEAQRYLEAYKNYPTLDFWETINPFSKYRTNALEKDARKASRSK